MATTQTPNTSAAAYVDPPTFFTYYTPTVPADVLKAAPAAPRPSYLAMIDPANPAGQKLLVFLNRGAGEIEAACSIAKRYSPADLNALTGVSKAFLQWVNAARSMWAIFQRLKPGSARPDECPGAVESAEVLDKLRDGERIFSFAESQDAGLPSVNPPQPANLLTPNIVAYATRLFPSYPGINRNNSFG